MTEVQQDDGWVLADRYRVDAPLGKGNMGEVHLGYDRDLDRRVAIKLMQQPTAQAPAASHEAASLARDADKDRKRFEREIKTTAGLELPGVPAVYDVGVDQATGRIFLVMQLLVGQTVKDLIASFEYPAEPMPVSWASALTAQVAATLVDVHRVDVVHRDIKPSNLMIVSTGLVKVLDFGIALLKGARTLPRLTQVGIAVGTAEYMAPEQVLQNPTGPPADVYALGCVLYEMLTGYLPFTSTATRSFYDHHVKTPPPSVRTARPEVPADLDALVETMLAKAPDDRPDASAVYETLLPFIRPEPSDGPKPSGGDPRRPFLRPLAPMQPARRAMPQTRPLAPPAAPLTVDELIEIHGRVMQLHDQGQNRQAIDLMDDAVARAADEPRLALEAKIMLVGLLFPSDEFGRTAALVDSIATELDGREDAPSLYYCAGVSHAEIGHIQPAIRYLTAYLSDADPRDDLARDAAIRLASLLASVGRYNDALGRLEPLRPIVAGLYGPRSVQATSLDRMITDIRARRDQL